MRITQYFDFCQSLDGRVAAAKDLRQWERELACKIKVEADTGLHIETFSILDNTGVDK